jgi:hypothetical protein
MAAGSELGEYFQSSLGKNDKQAKDEGHSVEMGWRTTANMSENESVQNLLGVVESWGVKANRLPAEEGAAPTKYRKEGAKNAALNRYAEEAYAFTQAFFKYMGLKEVTLFRGVQGQGLDKLKKGDEAELETRSLSSFSLNASLAESFGHPGGSALEFKVPVKDIFMSPLTNPGLSTESELMVFGPSKVGTVYSLRKGR